MIKIVYNNKSRGQIRYDEEAQFQHLFEKLTYRKTKFGRNQERSVEIRNPISPVGSFLSGIALDLKRLEPEIEIEPRFLSYHFPFLGPRFTIEKPLEPPSGIYKYRDYQREAIINASKFGRGIIDSPTASGKSIIIYGLITNLIQMQKGRILILVPNPGLVTQLTEDFKKYGKLEDFGTWTSGVQPCPDKRIVLMSRTIVRKDTLELIGDAGFEHVIIDEVHKLIRGSAYEKVIKIVDTKSIFGLTATMPEDQDEDWFIRGNIGPVVFKAHAHELQEQNYLAKINIVQIKFEHLDRPDHIVHPTYDLKEFPTRQYTDEYQYLESHGRSIDYIAALVDKVKGNTMILFDHTAHGKALFKACSGNKMFVDGSVKMDEREDVKQALEENDDLVLVAQSTCFGTGISINNIKNLVICSHSKKLTKIIQQVGRGLRKTHDGDEYMFLFDCSHNFKYSERHCMDRQRLYRKFYQKTRDKVVTVRF